MDTRSCAKLIVLILAALLALVGVDLGPDSEQIESAIALLLGAGVGVWHAVEKKREKKPR